MEFQLKVKQNSEMKDGELCAWGTKMNLVISRDEMIRAYEEDEIQCCLEIRQIVYMYHYSYGYVTQLSDDSIRSIYQHIKENDTFKEVIFYLEDVEKVYPQEMMTRGHNVTIDVIFQ